MNKKIKDAAKDHVYNLAPPVNVCFMDTEEAVNWQAERSFKTGAEWAFNECIKIIDRTVKTPEELGTIKLVIGALLVKDEIKYLYLSSEGKNAQP